MNPILELYVPLVDFLADMLGDQCEVVLHDTINVESSIIAIRNGHISGRKVGWPLTDLAIRLLKNNESDYIANYKGKTKEGKILRSSTFIIKDFSGKTIGMLCININVSEFQAAREILDRIINGDVPATETEFDTIEENFNNTLESLTSTLISHTISKFNISPDRMTQEEKIKVVHELDEKGVFLIKGSTSEVANFLNVSEPTIYRYLKKDRSKNNK